jgi:hypothetical protein
VTPSRTIPALALIALVVSACGSSGGGASGDAGSDAPTTADGGFESDAHGGGGADASGTETGSPEGGGAEAGGAEGGAPEGGPVSCLDGGTCGTNQNCCVLTASPTYGRCYPKACLACCQ